jgi:hypothetical protein
MYKEDIFVSQEPCKNSRKQESYKNCKKKKNQTRIQEHKNLGLARQDWVYMNLARKSRSVFSGKNLA